MEQEGFVGGTSLMALIYSVLKKNITTEVLNKGQAMVTESVCDRYWIFIVLYGVRELQFQDAIILPENTNR